jgi:hypothetical protein
VTLLFIQPQDTDGGDDDEAELTKSWDARFR